MGTPNNFGLLWQWPVNGRIYAQPLAVTLSQTVGTCQDPCDLIFVATEQDMLCAFNAASSSQTPVWSRDLAAFPTPTVFNGQVYVGTQTEVNVFGICPPPPGKCENWQEGEDDESKRSHSA